MDSYALDGNTTKNLIIGSQNGTIEVCQLYISDELDKPKLIFKYVSHWPINWFSILFFTNSNFYFYTLGCQQYSRRTKKLLLSNEKISFYVSMDLIEIFT